ncbi:hypothetical protein NN6n1_01040 [Shinella zoogloeoides]
MNKPAKKEFCDALTLCARGQRRRAACEAVHLSATFAVQMAGRSKRILGDLFGLSNFGVNLTALQPGCRSAMQHRHSCQDEFVYALEGEAVLVCGTVEVPLHAGMCAGFAAGGVSHHIENRGTAAFTYLEIGDRTAGDLGSIRSTILSPYAGRTSGS